MWIKDGQVKVNGQISTQAGILINPEQDQVEVNGKVIKPQTGLVYLALNKPLGVVSTTADDLHRPTVIDLVKSKARLYPVGRLDEDSSGLILLTNDGQLTNHLTHPSHHISKTYHVVIQGKVSPDQVNLLSTGVYLKEGKTSPAQVKILETSNKKTLLEITIHEGRNRQIRRMCGNLNLDLLELKRISIGSLQLGDLKLGQSRALTDQEISDLKNASD